MNSNKLILALRTKFGVTTDAALRRALGLSQMTLQNWRTRTRVTPRIIAQQMHRLANERLAGQDVVDALHKTFQTKSLDSLAKNFGVTLQAVQGWKARKNFTAKQTAKLVSAARKASNKESYYTALRPLVEFFPIIKWKAKPRSKFQLFSVKLDTGGDHPYRSGLRKELEAHHGIYVFFDSRGQAIYVGKARKQKLWPEMTNAFNRKRGAIQKIWRVKHPERRQKYKTSDEKARQIDEYVVPLHELATYFSAYDVADGMVNKLEALLVRSFANGLLNKRMETFGRKKKK